MESVEHYLQALQLHPVIDHFTIGLLFTAVFIDLIASMAPTRTWVRYTALTLMILGALAAGGSYATGDMEADRIWNALGQPAKEVLKTHALLGEYLAIAFGVLALWRILIESFGFMAGSRWIYLFVAIAAAATLGYSGHLGGELVYDYGAGTALMASAPAPSEAASPAAAATSEIPATPLPTVTVPTPLSTPVPAPAATASPTESPRPDASASPAVSPSATASPGAAVNM